MSTKLTFLANQFLSKQNIGIYIGMNSYSDAMQISLLKQDGSKERSVYNWVKMNSFVYCNSLCDSRNSTIRKKSIFWMSGHPCPNNQY